MPSIVYAQQYAFVGMPEHTFADGDVVQVTLATFVDFNGFVTVHYIDEDNFAYFVGEIVVPPETPDTTAEIVPVIANYFAGIFYAGIGNLDLVQEESTGDLLVMNPFVYTDSFSNLGVITSVPIIVKLRSSNLDAQTSDKKFFDEATLISDKNNGVAYLRYSDDDYATWSKFLPLNTNLNLSRVRRLGAAYRRAFELQHSEDTPFRAEALDILAEKGVQ